MTDEMEMEMETSDDRAATAPTDPNLSNGTRSNRVCAVAAVPVRDAGRATTNEPIPLPRPRRQLRATFRVSPAERFDTSRDGAACHDTTLASVPAPASDAPRSSDPGATGSAVPSAPAGSNLAPAPASGTNDLEGWRAAIQQTDPASPSLGSGGLPADQGSARRGRRVRGRERGTSGGTSGAGWTGSYSAAPRASHADEVNPEPVHPTAATASTPKFVPSPAERADARRLFREIGARFNQNRKKSRTAAYAAYRHDLMENMDTLIMGGAIELKEITTVITNLEALTKETEEESRETPATVLGRWLRMEPGEVKELEEGKVTAKEADEDGTGDRDTSAVEYESLVDTDEYGGERAEEEDTSG